MKLEKAIEILTIYRDEGCGVDAQDLDDSLTLGSEALKFTVDIRTRYPTLIHEMLPGETEDD